MPRNSSGTMSLPTPGVPFQSGATISSSQVNTTLADVAAEITSSLDRTGRGGMTGPLRTADGTVAAPSHAFTNDTGSGLYRAGAGDIRVAVGGVDALKLAAGGVVGPLTLPSGTTSIQVTLTGGFLLLQGNCPAADASNADVQLSSTATRTAGYIASVQNPPGTSKLFIDYQGLLRLATQAAAIQPASLWTAITPNALWTAGSGLAYWKDAQGIVHLKGSVQYATGASSPAFTLPAGFRPAAIRSWAMFSVSQSAAAAFHVNADGTASGDNAVNGFTYSLDAVAFLAEQ